MKATYKFITFALASSLSISLSSCGDKKSADTTKSEAENQQSAKTHDSVSKEFIASLGEMSDTLTKIKDLESAQSALPTLTKIGFKMKMIKTDMEKLGPPPKAMKAKLDEEYGSKMKEIMTNIGQTMNSLKTSNPEAYGLLEKVMTTIMQ
ncbi:MAG: hypothetical protein ACSHX6_09750 [Akkermansiaceae bacterium]